MQHRNKKVKNLNYDKEAKRWCCFRRVAECLGLRRMPEATSSCWCSSHADQPITCIAVLSIVPHTSWGSFSQSWIQCEAVLAADWITARLGMSLHSRRQPCLSNLHHPLHQENNICYVFNTFETCRGPVPLQECAPH